MFLRILPLFLIGISLQAMDRKTQEEIEISNSLDLYDDWQHIALVEQKNTDVSLLYWAKKGCVERIKTLLQEDAMLIDTQDPETEDTALHLAAKNGHQDTIKILLAYKAGLAITNTKGNTSLHDAIRTRQELTLIDLLLIHQDIKLCCNIKNAKGLTPLFIALNRLKRICCTPKSKRSQRKDTTYNIDTVKSLIVRLLDVGDNSQVNIPNNKQQLPIHIALETQQQDIIKKLIVATDIPQALIIPTLVTQEKSEEQKPKLISQKKVPEIAIDIPSTSIKLSQKTNWWTDIKEKIEEFFATF